MTSFTSPAPAEKSIRFEFLPDGRTPVVSSKEVAARFGKKHKDVLREIDRLGGQLPADFCGRNFAPTEESVAVPASGGFRQDRAFALTRDGFTLLAMGFTGAAAVQWKLKYIEAFNALERAVLENARADALTEGARMALRLTPARRRRMRRASVYRDKGLSMGDIAKLLDVNKREVHYLLRTAEVVEPKRLGA
ncbi:phage regulatory protein, rha family [Humidesulfovibrio mexicanus]|uniref:Phage regulatory protein, rha family n=1 Tax=Humidesulfovibrio mexicanus TaxID=147047 RepID=A0A239AKN3_9BACT|nr:Rha family transcriptional regulator [Humidesulfovibrio mexicanus]SNR95624.1 phage regulatory protein, rha family [Humidesulfovibrio mexicanus]